MKRLFLFLTVAAILFSCKKEEAPEPTPIPVDLPAVYVPIYQPGDTTLGAAYAKKLTANWKAESSCRIQSYFDANYISIVSLTYNNNGEQSKNAPFPEKRGLFSSIPNSRSSQIAGIHFLDSKR